MDTPASPFRKGLGLSVEDLQGRTPCHQPCRGAVPAPKSSNAIWAGKPRPYGIRRIEIERRVQKLSAPEVEDRRGLRGILTDQIPPTPFSKGGDR